MYWVWGSLRADNGQAQGLEEALPAACGRGAGARPREGTSPGKPPGRMLMSA